MFYETSFPFYATLIIQAVKHLLELPLNLTVVSPAHTPNWDLVSDVVNSCSRIYRSSKQCRSRYENVIIPREEGKVRNCCFMMLSVWWANMIYKGTKFDYKTNGKEENLQETYFIIKSRGQHHERFGDQYHSKLYFLSSSFMIKDFEFQAFNAFWAQIC